MRSIDAPSPTQSRNKPDRGLKGAWRRFNSSRSQEDTSRLRTLSQENDPPPTEYTKGSLGLNLLCPRGDAKIDFIFVHGLGGGSRKTWEHSPNSQQYWPMDWLSLDPEFASVRVHSFGYPADLDERGTRKLRILDFAKSLLDHITTNPLIRKEKTQIVLIGHSLGGIVIKQAFMLARDNASLYQDFADRVHSMYFFATPHGGADHTKLLSNILTLTYGDKSIVCDLSQDSAAIGMINEGFANYARNIRLCSFYETKTTRVGGLDFMIVDKSSATLRFADEKRVMLNADHRHVCKFQSKDDPNYKIIRNLFLVTIDTILSKATDAEYHQLALLTGISNVPEDILMELDDRRANGTCEWLLDRPAYCDWQAADIGNKPFFWLTGRAGSGKSVLSGRVVNQLKSKDLHCSYFFFKSSNSSLGTCLRSIAYQMAKTDSFVLRRLLQIPQPSLTGDWAAMDDNTLWHKIFLPYIFDGPKSQQTHYWVVDSIDECKRGHLLLNFMDHLPPWLKVFYTSRSDPDTDKIMSSLADCTHIYPMHAADTLHDLKVFIDSKLANVHFIDEIFKQKLLDKASGSFMWISLVTELLLTSYSPEVAEEILNEVPSELDKLYGEMLLKVMQNKRAITLARSVYMWTLLSQRPLAIAGLQVAIKIDTNQTVYNLHKVIPAISGQLIYVNQKHEAEIIHQTAKSYLLTQDIHPELMLEKVTCHTRMSEICFTALIDNFKRTQHFQATRRRSDVKSTPIEEDFIDYACEYFSDHLQKSDPESDEIWELLCAFLDGHLPSWIEFLGNKQSLRSLIKTAQNIRSYLKRRLKYVSPISPQKSKVESWLQDLFRLGAKFGTSLNISPSSIHHLVPWMCPKESSIAKYRNSGVSRTGFEIKGLTNIVWGLPG